MIPEAGVKLFFEYVRERERIRRLRATGAPPPWTADPVLQANHFCNVFREDDRTTVWFREHLRERLRDRPEAVALATVVFRWFNRIETGEVLALPEVGLTDGQFNPGVFKQLVKSKYPKGPYVTGAFIIRTPFGMNKLDGVLWAIQNFVDGEAKPDGLPPATLFKAMDRLAEKNARGEATLEGAWNWFRRFPLLGAFMAYEVVTDLRHTCLLDKATDIMTWANPGPGACRGMERLLGLEPGSAFNRSNPKHCAEVNQLMQALLAGSQKSANWPVSWGRWEMREVEHSLCEVFKMVRVRDEGGKMKKRFKPSRRD